MRKIKAIVSFALVSILFAACGTTGQESTSLEDGTQTPASTATGNPSTNQENGSESNQSNPIPNSPSSVVPAPDIGTANHEGFIDTLDLSSSDLTISEMQLDSVSEIEGVAAVGAGQTLIIVFDENTTFIRSVSNNTEKTTEYFSATEDDLVAGAYVKVWGMETGGTVSAEQILIMFTV